MRKPLSDPFWERVKVLIKRKKITQKKLAAQIRISYGTMRYWIDYGLLPSVITAFNIADALGTSVEYLVWGKEKRSPKIGKIAINNRKDNAKTNRKIVGKT
jgi:DNA-binding XRE family transcriptional regulator